jgi:pilus assembly protein CpaE
MLFAMRLRWPTWTKHLIGDERGVSAIEFAFLAPVLAFACLAAIDCGLAVREKMTVDSTVRAASEGALADLGEAEVHSLLDSLASEHFTIGASDMNAQTPLTTSVERFCACPENASSTVDCDTAACAGSADPYLYYRLSAAKQHQTILLPYIPLQSSILVQVE